MTTRLDHITPVPYDKTFTLTHPSITDITGYEIRGYILSMDKATIYHESTTEGVSPEITITDLLEFRVKIDDWSSVPESVVRGNFIMRPAGGEWMPASFTYEIRVSDGETPIA